MKPKGPTPHVLVELDDLVFDLDCSAEAQVGNTEDMLPLFAEIFRDGRVDCEDTEEILSLLRRTKVEHKLNAQQSLGVKQARRLLNPCFDLITNLRAQLQLARQQTARG